MRLDCANGLVALCSCPPGVTLCQSKMQQFPATMNHQCMLCVNNINRKFFTKPETSNFIIVINPGSSPDPCLGYTVFTRMVIVVTSDC